MHVLSQLLDFWIDHSLHLLVAIKVLLRAVMFLMLKAVRLEAEVGFTTSYDLDLCWVRIGLRR